LAGVTAFAVRAAPERGRLSRDLVVARVGCFRVLLAKSMTNGIVRSEVWVFRFGVRAVLQVSRARGLSPAAGRIAWSWACRVVRLAFSSRAALAAGVRATREWAARWAAPRNSTSCTSGLELIL
jgi:hypothetical protein